MFWCIHLALFRLLNLWQLVRAYCCMLTELCSTCRLLTSLNITYFNVVENSLKRWDSYVVTYKHHSTPLTINKKHSELLDETCHSLCKSRITKPFHWTIQLHSEINKESSDILLEFNYCLETVRNDLAKKYQKLALLKQMCQSLVSTALAKQSKDKEQMMAEPEVTVYPTKYVHSKGTRKRIIGDSGNP